MLTRCCPLGWQEAVSRVRGLEEMGHITGVIDDRGKFIYISEVPGGCTLVVLSLVVLSPCQASERLLYILLLRQNEPIWFAPQ